MTFVHNDTWHCSVLLNWRTRWMATSATKPLPRVGQVNFCKATYGTVVNHSTDKTQLLCGNMAMLASLTNLAHASTQTSFLQATLLHSMLCVHRHMSSVLSDDGSSRIRLEASDAEVEELIESNLVRMTMIHLSSQVCTHVPTTPFTGQAIQKKGRHNSTTSAYHAPRSPCAVRAVHSSGCAHPCTRRSLFPSGTVTSGATLCSLFGATKRVACGAWGCR